MLARHPVDSSLRQIAIRSTASSVSSSSRRPYSLVVLADSWQALRMAFCRVPPLVR